MKHVQKRSLATRERILSAAKHLFAQTGYEQTSVEQIAKDADVAKGTVFAHFRDKTNLLAAAGSEEMTRLLEVTARSADAEIRTCSDNEMLERVLDLYDPWLAFFTDNPEFARLFLNQSALSRGEWSDMFIEACSAMENHVGQFIARTYAARGQTGGLSPAFIANGMQAFFFHVVIHRLPGWIPDHGSARVMLRDYLAVWFRGVGAEAA